MDQVATLIRQGNFDQAEAELSKRKAESTSNPEWHYLRGRLLDGRGEADGAMACYRAAMAVDGEHCGAAFRLAFGLDLYGDEEEALRLYEQLADRIPTHVNALMNLAIMYEDAGRHEEALKCVERVLGEYPNHARARMFAKDIASSMNMFYDEDHERTRQKRSAIMDTPVTDFELSVRSRNCLRKMNIHTLGDLLRVSEPELLAYKNFGETSLNEIKAMLSQKSLRLGQLHEEPQRPASRPTTSRRPASQGSPDVLNKFLSEIEFSSRSRKCLQRLNLVTLGDLTTKSEAELLSTKNFGQTSLVEVKQKLAEFGLTLRKTD